MNSNLTLSIEIEKWMLIRGKKIEQLKNRKLGHIQETWKQELVKWLSRYKNFQEKP